MPEIETFSAFLLDLYRLEKERPMAAFQDEALSQLRQVVPFDSAWWGMAAMDTVDIRLHCSHVYRLPADFPAQWYTIRANDTLALRAYEQPGRTLRFCRRALREQPHLSELTARHDIDTALTTVVTRPKLGLLTFLSVYRGYGSAAFTEAERTFIEIAMPHLAAAWNGNWVVNIDRLSAECADTHSAAAVADTQGVLHVAEDRFQDLLTREWPRWFGPHLPEPLIALLAGERGRWRGNTLIAGVYRHGGLHLLWLRPRGPADRLTPRELAVVRVYAGGRSHKEVAASLGLSPATVRHYLRNAYTKLDVSDKAQLSTLLHNTASTNDSQAPRQASARQSKERRRSSSS
ncbi:helix-turn-helix transcriptional regulator [Arhodomonas aquaeolei]|uniref:helix-turn-helix transcriptional regulator n=1 Tax=Arhodomonas aquaeolei TaxID=2369 RepID=UPI0003718F38|nr:helix-turn-helix transcriptional regulator [Arhodomonas aquaeolei]